jgi:hypothetical protein
VKWLKTAFAVDDKGPLDPTEEQLRLVDRLAGEVVRRGLTTPALFALEMCRPLNYLGSQAMLFFQPMVSVLFDTGGYRQFADFMEHRDSVDFLCRRIEEMESRATSCETDAKRASQGTDTTE